MGRPGGLAWLERGWRTSRGAARRAPRATLGSVLIKFLLRAADYAAIASVPAGLKWKPGVEPGFFWSQVRSGSNSVLRVFPLHVRLDAGSGIRSGAVRCRTRATTRHHLLVRTGKAGPRARLATPTRPA